jgi:hypothetical protein
MTLVERFQVGESTPAIPPSSDTPAPKGETPKAGEAITTTQTPVRPEGLPEKFATVADLVKSYTELESKMGSKPAGDTPVDAAAVEKAGFKMADLSAEFLANDGKLTDETLKALEAKGFDKSMVDGFIAGQRALAEKMTGELADFVGGKEKFSALLKWAQTALSDGEKQAYNNLVDSGNIDSAKLALAGLASRFNAEHGSEATLLDGESTSTNDGVAPFLSVDEMSRAMLDPRYKTDSAYRNTVERRVGKSNLTAIAIR